LYEPFILNVTSKMTQILPEGQRLTVKQIKDASSGILKPVPTILACVLNELNATIKLVHKVCNELVNSIPSKPSNLSTGKLRKRTN
jgi:hypothetical protein